MHYIRQHIQEIIARYEGSLPLSHFLKQYLKQHPKLGSRDRKMLHELAYSWYRCSKGFEALSFEEKINACLLLCGSLQKAIDLLLPEDMRVDTQADINTRLGILKTKGIPFNIDQLFPHTIDFSEGINKTAWLWSMLHQPHLFIRVRKQKDKIISLLDKAAIPYQWINDSCMALPNGAAIDKLLPDDTYVVQDASSQETGNYFQPKKNEEWYDCCSGAGGKSLLLNDNEPSIRLTVSDKRASILHNLKNRFRQYHLTIPDTYTLDVADKTQLQQLEEMSFDGIICDVPCSGSGTWARTPEQFYYFDPAIINNFSKLQYQIATNAASKLKQDGKLIYITCSVFQEENGNVVDQLAATTGLTIEQKQLINGIDKKADSMFVAVLKK